MRYRTKLRVPLLHVVRHLVQLLAALPFAALLLTSLPATPAHADPLPALEQAIDKAIGTPTCTTDAQCRSLPLGERACGGPDSFRPYSIKTAQTAQLEKLAQQHAAERRAANKASGRMGICQVLPDPGARCQASTQRCVLREAQSPQ
jgi:hypothetical protein